jgi:asparagine synthase (glutamine-hydrolysing)
VGDLHLLLPSPDHLVLAPLKSAVFEAVSSTAHEEKLGVAFSGGIDSALLARVCSDLGKRVLLLTVGFPGAHDIEFSKQISTLLALPQQIIEINERDFQRTLQRVHEIIQCDNTSHIENCIAYHYIASAAKHNDLRTVLSANGCDELFCGYNGYRVAYDDGPEALGKLMDEKIENEYRLVDEINSVAKQFEVVVRQPFLDPSFVSFAKTIPFDLKIKGSSDMLRKHILRQLALDMGVPKESALKPKKALQYGSLIHKNFQKARKSLRRNLD